MYLKRLDIQGFKSFANKTTLHFTEGVTCVVGPNGTGKTNVADSLRWVLGEHASRMLRARKTEDVIFAGSEKRAPVGVAEVSIALDNSEHWLPIDFDEVVVSRRAYRSGENEYLINNSKVRLRDVVDLFMRAQVGQNSYAFMGQGMVEQVLSLRPEDRRALIEEAADVRLYRSRLEDAQHKLKATRENMDRVRLLVREIEPRIRQLERQAGRAVKYQELTRELATTLHVWYSHQWQEVNEALLAAMATQEQRQEELDRLRAEARACEDGLGQLNAAIGERRNEIHVREERLRSLQDYARDLERRAALDAERGRMLGERIAELEAELAVLEEDARHVEVTERDTSELQARAEEARVTLAGQRERLEAVEQRLQELQRGAFADEQTAAQALATVERLSRRIDETADAIARLRRERDAGQHDRRTVVGELAAWAKEYARASSEMAQVAPALDQAVRERETDTIASAAYREEHAKLDAELRELRTRLEAVRVRRELVERLEAPPQAPEAGVRAVLEAGGVLKRETVPEDIELRGVVGVVGQIIRVPSGLEKAIEAALAENLFAVVFERESELKRAVKLLLGDDTGRATMYALDSFQEARPLNLIKERGVVGVASGLVKCNSRYRRLVDTLLGRTVVVEDLAMAERVVRRGLASAVATLDGVLLRPQGSVSAGTITAVEATFARERELGDLPEEEERLDAQIAEREAALAHATSARDEAERRADELARRVDELRERRALGEAALTGLKARLDAFRTKLGAHDSAMQDRERRIDALVRERTAAEAERETRAEAARDAETRQAQAGAEMASLEEEQRSLAAVTAEQAAIVAQLDGELRTERQATDAERSAHERLLRQIEAKRQQRDRSRDEAQATETRLAATRRELEEKSEEVGGLEAELQPARGELAQFESHERELAQQLAETNERVRTAERALYETENDVRARRDELEALRRSLEEEGFVATADGEIERVERPEPQPEPEDEPEEAYATQDGSLPGWLRSDEGDLPPMRGGSTINPTEVRDRIAELRGQIRGLGPVNETAASEYEESRERYDFLTGQLNDLSEAETQLNEAASELEAVIRERFRATFRTVNREFERYFSAFFRGGTARLELGETDEYGLPGIEIFAQPPGKKLGSLALLSGGERSLTAVALLFALLQANPSPICVLDEVDAALDEANVGRFVEELRELSKRTQFIIITHNRRTIEAADAIYGVSMGADNVSRVISLKLSDVTKDLAD